MNIYTVYIRNIFSFLLRSRTSSGGYRSEYSTVNTELIPLFNLRV